MGYIGMATVKGMVFEGILFDAGYRNQRVCV